MFSIETEKHELSVRDPYKIRFTPKRVSIVTELMFIQGGWDWMVCGAGYGIASWCTFFSISSHISGIIFVTNGLFNSLDLSACQIWIWILGGHFRNWGLQAKNNRRELMKTSAPPRSLSSLFLFSFWRVHLIGGASSIPSKWHSPHHRAFSGRKHFAMHLKTPRRRIYSWCIILRKYWNS